MTATDTGVHPKRQHAQADSPPVAPHPTAPPRPRTPTRHREAILDAALVVAAAGGYEAVRMRTVAERAGIAVGTLYRYFPSKTHLLVSALAREFGRLQAAQDWAATGTTPQQRLDRLTGYLHDRWQHDIHLTEAMTRAFVAADSTAAAALDEAAAVIERLLAHPLGGGTPGPLDQPVAELLADIWLANLTAFIGRRASAAQTRDRIDRASRRIVDRLASLTPNS